MLMLVSFVYEGYSFGRFLCVVLVFIVFGAVFYQHYLRCIVWVVWDIDIDYFVRSFGFHID